MIDTHCHLFDEAFNDDRLECLKRCEENGVNKLIIVGFSEETNIKAYELSKLNDNYFPTAGMHPDEASYDYLEKLKKLEDFISNHKVYAIGECGLDYHYGKDLIEEQKKLFKAQCDLASKLDLPLIVHMRDATLDTYEILKEYKGRIRGVMHCYSGSLEMAYEFIKLGFYISLGGPVTFKNAKESIKVALNIPLDKLILETDCPYLAPTPYRGKRNESSFIIKTYERVSEIRNISFNELEEIIASNVNKLFGI